MDKSLIKKKYKEKLKLLIRHNEKYYSDNSPIISDYEYDSLKQEILNLEKKFVFLKDHSRHP